MITDIAQKPVLNTKDINKNADININRKSSETKETSKTPQNERELKIQKIKEMIEKGEYKIDLDATARKIAEELL